MQRVSRASALLSLFFALTCVLRAGELPQGTPQSAGLSGAKLAAAEQAVQDLVEKQLYAGAVTLVLRHGKIVEWRTYGMADLARGKPMRKDTIFRIHSMTKPIVT